MRIVRTAIIAGVAAAALAGAAFAAHDQGKTMLVALPDGSVQHIRYEGDATPRVVLVPVRAPATLYEAAFGPASPFAEMERISAALDAQAAAMMRQAAMMEAQAPAANGEAITLTNAAGQPVGVMHYSYVSSTRNADGCTRTVRISSAGSEQQPRVIRTSAGDCGAAQPAPSPAIAPGSPAARAVASVKAAPATKPAPKVTPVSAPKPLPEFTPSFTI
ncbi:hypothetical protein ASE00_14110 [Sphingomonas sp. Root710]|uniref:hypothetical protein n=1 Tax=Sphingomonas sp. Root710 TaxID=1736594 RepID=UPI0006F7FB3C|nr:hypothetical protein [Sphingomonas sp. Root710]KRB81145.1 hypothetical protein ASE00_14110 [Sphingomonas sp. Root710]